MAEQLCLISGCNHPSRTKGLCQAHIMQLRRGATLPLRDGSTLDLNGYAQGRHLDGMEQQEVPRESGVPQGDGPQDQEQGTEMDGDEGQEGAPVPSENEGEGDEEQEPPPFPEFNPPPPPSEPPPLDLAEIAKLPARVAALETWASAEVPAWGTALNQQMGTLAGRVTRIEAMPIPQSQEGGGGPVKIILTTDTDTREISVDTCHHDLLLLLKLATMKVAGKLLNIMLVGPAGSGKTHVARQLSDVLGLPFHFQGQVTHPSEVLGFRGIDGEVRPTPFRAQYTRPSLTLFDEYDIWAPDAQVAINAALENGICSFPDGVEARHPDAIVICSANTGGQGATALYSSREKLDAAALDRFVYWQFPIDAKLERALAGGTNACKPHKAPNDVTRTPAECDAWVDFVQACRKAADKAGMVVNFSPRASIRGNALLQAGFERSRVEKMVLFRDLERDQVAKIKDLAQGA